MDAIDLSGINYLAVLIAGVAHLAAGLVWFSPASSAMHGYGSREAI
jgi:hypothetical protein